VSDDFNTKAAWDQLAGLPTDEEDTNYFVEMVTSQGNINGILGAVGVGALLTFTGGLGLAAVPILLYAAGLGVASLFVPSSPVFQDAVNRRKRQERQEKTRNFLLAKIEEKRHFVDNDGWLSSYSDYRSTYHRMRDRLVSLRKVAGDSHSNVSEREMERLEEATVDYLRVLYAKINVRERLTGNQTRKIERKISDLEGQIEAATTAADRRALGKLKQRLEKSLDNRARLPAKDAQCDGRLMVMAETFEEIYHRITSNPAASSVSEYLSEAADRLSIEEELEAAVEDEMDELTRYRRQKQAQNAALRN